MLSRFPADRDENRVRRVVDHYENQSDEEAVAEDKAVLGKGALTKVPAKLVKENEDSE